MAHRSTDEVSTTRAWKAYQCMRALLAGRIGRDLARDADLSEAEFDILTVLSEMDRSSLRLLSLRCALAWEKSRVSHQIIRMEKRGLVRREACEEDGRGAMIGLTEAGEAAFARGRIVYQRLIDRYFGEVLTPEQLAALERISTDIAARLVEDEPHPHHANGELATA